MEIDQRIEPWMQFFEREASRRPELGGGIVDAIRDELSEMDATSRFLWRAEDEHNARMIEEAKVRIAEACRNARARLALERHDEQLLLRSMGITPRHSFPLGPRGGVPDKALSRFDDMLDSLVAMASADGEEGVHGASHRQQSADCYQDACAVATAAATHLASDSVQDAIGAKAPQLPPVNRSVPELDHYEFPGTEEEQADFAHLSDSDLLALLNSLLNERDASGALVSYLVIRRRYCAVSEIMNRRGVTPPRFRPKRPLQKPVKGAKHDAADTVMMLDRQILDMHWLHSRGKRDRLAPPEFAGLFEGEELDLELATRLARKGWSLESKACKVLNLIPFEQWQMAYLRPNDVDNAWRNARVIMNTTIDRRLREHTVKEPAFRSHIEDMKLLWLAHKMAGHESQKVVGVVYGWLTGAAPLAASTLSLKLRRMKRRTTPKGCQP